MWQPLTIAISRKRFFRKNNIGVPGGTKIGVSIADVDNKGFGWQIAQDTIALTRRTEARAGFIASWKKRRKNVILVKKPIAKARQLARTLALKHLVDVHIKAIADDRERKAMLRAKLYKAFEMLVGRLLVRPLPERLRRCIFGNGCGECLPVFRHGQLTIGEASVIFAELTEYSKNFVAQILAGNGSIEVRKYVEWWFEHDLPTFWFPCPKHLAGYRLMTALVAEDDRHKNFSFRIALCRLHLLQRECGNCSQSSIDFFLKIDVQ
jgi:hypothetical protein